MAFRGLLRYMAVSEENRFGKCDCAGADLVVPFIVGEEEELVFFDRPSDGSAILPPHEERVFESLSRAGDVAQWVESGQVAGAFEAREGGHIVVAEEEEAAAMQIVRARAGDDVYGSGGDCSRREIEAQCADLELLDGVGGEVLRGSASEAVVDSRAIDRNHGRLLRSAVDRNLKEVISIARGGIWGVSDVHTRFQRRDREKTPAVQRKVLDPV